MKLADAKFIVIEGLNHSGKSTQVARLFENLKKHGIPAEANKEPTQRIFGKIIRRLVDKENPTPTMLYEAVGYLYECGISRDVLSHSFVRSIESTIDKLRSGKEIDELERQLLFFADRSDDIQNVIHPRLKNNIWNIQDRFDLSTFAHGLSWGLGFEALRSYHSASVARLFMKPDLLFFIKLDPDDAFRRLNKDRKTTLDRNEESVAQLSKTLNHYLELINDPEKGALFSMGDIKVIDGRKSIDAVSSLIWQEIEKRFL